MAVGTQQVEGGFRDACAGELLIVDRIVGNPMGEHQVIVISRAVRKRRLPDYDQIEARIVEFRE